MKHRRIISFFLLSVMLLSLSACQSTAVHEIIPADTGRTAENETTVSDDNTVSEDSSAVKEKSIFDEPTDGFEFVQTAVCTNTINKNSYKAMFAKCAASDITVPGLGEYFVPQGMDFWDEEGVLLISGYFNPQDYCASSVLFAVDVESGAYVGEWKLYNTDGTPHSGHDGGVAVTEKDIYLSTSSKLFRISLDAVKKCGNHGNLQIEEEIPVPVRASYCNYSKGILWVGEFSIKGSESNNITGHDFGRNHAWTLGYELDADGKMKSVPSYCISTAEKIQGFTVLDDGSLFMTCSYGRTNESFFYVSSGDFLSSAADGTALVNGNEIPVYNPTLKSTVALPMAEGCCTVEGNAYILFESGAYYYRDMTSSKAKNPTDKIWIYTP